MILGKKSAAKSISLLWLGSIAGAGCAFITQVILARELGPASFGVFAAVLSMIMLVTPLAGFGVGSFWLKAFGQEGWAAQRWFHKSFLFISLTTFFVIIALMAWAFLGPHDSLTTFLITVMTFYLLGQLVVDLVSAKLQLEESYLRLAIWQFLPHLLRLLIIVFFAYIVTTQLTLNIAVYAYALISLCVFGLGAWLLSQLYIGKLRLKGHGDKSKSPDYQIKSVKLRDIASQSWPFGFAGIFYLIYFQSAVILLKYLVGDEAAGIYNVAIIILVAVYMLPSVIYQKFLLPKMHRWSNNDRKMFYQVFRVGNWGMLILGVVAMILIWLFAPFGIKSLFGAEYQGAIMPLMILAFAVPLRFVSTSVGAVLVTQEHMQKKVCYMGIVALINVIFCLILIPVYGVIGAAIATTISDIVLLLFYFLGSKHVFLKSEKV